MFAMFLVDISFLFSRNQSILFLNPGNRLIVSGSSVSVA